MTITTSSSRTTASRSSTTMLSSLLMVLLVTLASIGSVQGRTPCHICGDQGNGAMAFPNVVLSNVGKTCTTISLEVALNAPLGSSQCTSEQNKWKGRCCNPNQRPSGSDLPGGLPPQNIPAVSYVGPHPVCNVCRDGDYPFATSMVINFLYIGEGSCAQYYRYGLEGRIQQHMCDPVKFFSYEPCGCGEFNPYFNANHPLNQQAQQAPGQNNRPNSGGSSGGGSTGARPQQQRVPERDSGKCDTKMSNNYGGSSGGQGCRRRELEENGGRTSGSKGLKGSTNKKKDYDSIAVVVEEDVVKEEKEDHVVEA